MQVGKLILLGTAAIVGIGLPTSSGIYYKNLRTIWDVVKEEALPDGDSLKEEWSLLKTALSETQKNLNDEKLKEIKSKSKNATEKNELRDWCVSAYSKIYRSLFQKENKLILEDVKAVCILSIKQKLGSQAVDISETKDETAIKANLELLKKHNEESKENLDEKLTELKKSIETGSENHWQTLRDWCKDTYEKPYQDPSDNVWKLASKFCKKSSDKN